jgi:hypothetical protein
MKHLISGIVLSAIALNATLPASSAPLPRANVVLQSATSVDLAANTVTLPLHRGTAKGATVWYIITDASDAESATKLGVLYSPLLASAGAAIATADGTIDNLRYPGTVDFSPTRVFRVDAAGTPTDAKPGSVGDEEYSPLVRIGNSGPVYNAPIVAACDAPHDIDGHTDTLDRVVAIDTKDAAHATVTLVLARGFTDGKPIAYISTDASVAAPAAIERSTYAPRLKKIAGGTVPIDVFFNGNQQGIPFAALKGHLSSEATAANASTLGSPLNLQATFPATGTAANGYSPLWSVYGAAWTKTAIAEGKAALLRSNDDVAKAAGLGLVTAPDGKPFGPAGITVDCPVVAFAAQRPN